MTIRRILYTCLTLVLLCGCQDSNVGEAPQLLSAASVDSWAWNGEAAKKIHTDHYLIYTTVQDPDVLAQLPLLMEGALAQYQQFAPAVALSDRPMECFVFRTRGQWNEFTRQNTGVDAHIYLQIRKGGYTVGDRFVAYYIGDTQTVSVMAHEGWHQYVARHFKNRLPPFLEEGIACMFEGASWKDQTLHWELTTNRIRAAELRRAIDGGTLFPLQTLMTMHAGQVVEQSGPKIEAFYAQSWAFARFMWEDGNGRYRQALRNWIADTAAGVSGGHWNPQAVRPLLEHYVGMPMDHIQREYDAFVQRIGKNEAPWADYRDWGM